MKIVLSGHGNSKEFANDFLEVKKEAEKEGSRYIVSRINEVQEAFGVDFKYEFWTGDYVDTMKRSFLGIDFVCFISNNKIFGEKRFINEFIKRIPEIERRHIMDRILVDFLLGKLSK